MNRYLPMQRGSFFTNLLVTAVVSSNTIVITVKGQDGRDLSAVNPGFICVRDASAAAGLLVFKRITSNLTLTVPAAASLSYANSESGPLYVYAVVSGASSDTIELGVSRYQYSDFILGGSSANSSAITTYTGVNLATAAAVTNARHVMIGKIDGTRGTGTWASIDGVVTGPCGQYSAGGVMLDGYEPDGEWTPSLYGTTSGSGSPQAASVATGQYTRVGELVHIDLSLTVNVASTITGKVRIGGLPFSFKGISTGLSWARIDNVPYTKGIPIFFIDEATSIIYCREMEAGDAAQIDLVAANWDGNVSAVTLRLSGSYLTDDPF